MRDIEQTIETTEGASVSLKDYTDETLQLELDRRAELRKEGYRSTKGHKKFTLRVECDESVYVELWHGLDRIAFGLTKSEGQDLREYLR